MAISIRRPADARRPPSARAIAFVVGASAFVALSGLFALSRSPLFALRHLDVRGASHRAAAEIRALSGLDRGTNVVWLDESAVEARLLSDPWIARAAVSRSLPWTVEIRVTERRPIAVVGGRGTGTLVAADGTTLGQAGRRTRLPLIVLPPAAPTTVGLPSESGAVRALGAMAPAIRHRVREVDVAIGGRLTIVLDDGLAVDLGGAVDLKRKARVLRRLLAWSDDGGTSLASVSLVAPSAPAAVLGP